MRLLLTTLLLAAGTLWLANCDTTKSTAGTASSVSDPEAANRSKALERVKAAIAGKENWPADSVFINVKLFNKVAAERYLAIMDNWGKTLGVGCDFCHVPNEWASEVKPEKETARQMVALTNKINADLKQLDMQGISCFTCHRGEKDPVRRPKS